MNSEGDASGQASKSKATPLNCLLSLGVGLVAAIVLSPIHRLMIAWTYSDGHYTDYPILIVLFGLGIGLLMALVRGGRGNVLMGILAGLVVLLGLAISEYLVAHYLLNQALRELGMSSIPVVLPPDVMLSILLDFLIEDPAQWILWFFSIGGAIFINVLSKSVPTGVHRSTDSKQRSLSLFRIGSPRSSAKTAFDSPPQSGISDVPTETYEMGSPLREYGTALWPLGWPIPVAVVSALGCFASLYLLFTINGLEGTPVYILLGAIGLGFLGFAVARLIVLLGNFDNRIVIFEKGILTTLKKQTHIFRWEDIEKLYHKKSTYKWMNVFPVYTVHKYRLVHRDGTEVVIREWHKKIDELGSTLHEVVTRHQLPQTTEKLQRGETLDFGTMTLSQEGIQVRKKLFPWSDIQSIVEAEGIINISRKSKGSSLVSMADTANPHLFLTLAERAIQSERQ